MKKKILIGLGLVLLAFIGYVIYGVMTNSSHSPLETVEVNDGDLNVKVVYCKPFKKGRLIFGDEADGALVPNGIYWRLGANDATEITFSKDVLFAGEAIAAGSYRMYAVPNADSWEVSLNSELGKFGYFEPNYNLDVAKVKIPVQVNEPEMEQLTVTFDNDSNGLNMNFIWDKTLIQIPIQAQ